MIALPTATGKSVVIAGFCYEALRWYPKTRIQIITHVKELIEQNFEKLRSAWPGAPAGIYSAGIGRKQLDKPITFAGIQSLHHVPDNKIPWVDLVGIDEAHLVSPNEASRYQQYIARLRQVNPRLKVFGLTATWWRNKQGSLTNSVLSKDGQALSALFTDICYDRTRPEDFKRFIAEGFLSPLIPRATRTKLDLSGVGVQNGEYNLKQLEEAVDQEGVTEAALREACYAGTDRRAWVAFCSGIQHAEHVAAVLNKWGIRTGVVHSKMSKGERDQTLRDWYSGKLRCVTNNNVLTTGIDFPALDFCIGLRPTMSSSLWVQMLGRLMRVSPQTGKVNGLVMDFAGNTARLGPVDDPEIPGQPKGGGGGDAPVKICDNCGTYNYTMMRYCTFCGAEFPLQEKLSAQADNAPLLSSDMPVIEEFTVSSVTYHDYVSKAERRSLRVNYHCGIRTFYEYIQFESTGFMRHKAHNWWKQRSATEPPETVEDAHAQASHLRSPTKIKVWVNQKYPEVLGYEWY